MAHRRIRTNGSAIAAPVLVGLGVGVAAGFVLGELYAGTGLRAVQRAWGRWRGRPSEPVSVQALTTQIQEALASTLGGDSQSLELIAVGRGGLELHGWVSSRSARTRALAAARRIAGAERTLVDRLLVWGEDDVATPRPPEEEPLVG
jgi:hypothetical protein